MAITVAVAYTPTMHASSNETALRCNQVISLTDAVDKDGMPKNAIRFGLPEAGQRIVDIGADDVGCRDGNESRRLSGLRPRVEWEEACQRYILDTVRRRAGRAEIAQVNG